MDAEEVESVFGRPIRRNKRINKLLNEGRLPYVQLAGPGRESRRRSRVESGRTSERTVAFPKSPLVPPFPQTLLPSKWLRTDFLAVTLPETCPHNRVFNNCFWLWKWDGLVVGNGQETFLLKVCMKDL